MAKTIKIPDLVHKELKIYTANGSERMEAVAGLAIMCYLKTMNHKFIPIKKSKINNGQ